LAQETNHVIPARDEIRETIERTGCDLFAFFEGEAAADPKPDDQCFIHSISHRDIELLAMNIRRDEAASVSGLMTKLMSNWESNPLKPGETCLAMGCNLMLQVVEPHEKFRDKIMDNMLRAAVDYRDNKDFSILILFPARRLTDSEVEEIST